MNRPQVVTIVAHAAGWLLFFSLVVGFVSSFPNGGNDIGSYLFSIPFLLFYFVYLFLFYFNTYLLIPQLYLKRKYLAYFGVVILLFMGIHFLRPFDNLMHHSSRNRPSSERIDNFRPPPPSVEEMPGPPRMEPGPGPGARPGPDKPGERNVDIIGLILFMTVISFSTALCIIRQWRNTQQRVIKAEADKANAELSFLKTQINPHFLFNTLNNIYSLAVTNSPNTADSIMKLSNIMRYVTDDVREDYVSLDNEIQCMTDYIDLQRMRLGASTTVHFNVTGNIINKKIAPLILMTFIENVFKYGVSNHEKSEIMINLEAGEKRIDFTCTNRIFEKKRQAERTGIGIANTRQRLQHLYPDKHSLEISDENGHYVVKLVLQL